MKQNIITLDVETGGFIPEQNPITEVALMVVEPNKFKELATYQSYIKPYADLKITKEAIENSQIDMADVMAGKNFNKVAMEIALIIKEYTLRGGNRATKPVMAGHNTGFDIGFMEFLFQNTIRKSFRDMIDGSFFDTMKIQQLMDSGKPKVSGESTSYKLSVVCDRMGIELKSAHGSMADVIATTQLLYAQTKILRQESGKRFADGEVVEVAKSRTFFEF